MLVAPKTLTHNPNQLPRIGTPTSAGSVLIDREQGKEITAAVENANHKYRRGVRLKQDQVALMNTATDIKTERSALGWLG